MKKRSPKKKERNPHNWTYTDAALAVIHLRPQIKELREKYIRLWHLYRLNGKT